MSEQCIYDVCWQGRCKNESITGQKFCEEHLNKKCYHCDNQSVGDCHKYNGSFVCGAPMCEEHKDRHYH